METAIVKKALTYKIVLNFPVEIYSEDFSHILDLMKKALISNEENEFFQIYIIETCDHIIKKYSPEDYTQQKNQTALKVIDALTLVADNTKQGHSIILKLNRVQKAQNHIMVESTDEVWIRGSAIELKKFIETRKSKVRHFIKKLIVNLNNYILFILISIFPSFPFKLRLSLSTFFVLMIVLNRNFYRTLTNGVLSPHQAKPLERFKDNPFFPAGVSAIISALVPILIYNLSGAFIRMWETILKLIT